MTIVADASVLVAIATDGALGPADASHAAFLAARAGHPVRCTPLARSEALAAFRRAAWSGAIGEGEEDRLLRNLEALPIDAEWETGDGARALAIARRMGWARTYDAEHCALAERLGALLLTCDLKLRRSAEQRLDYVVTTTELVDRLREPPPMD